MSRFKSLFLSLALFLASICPTLASPVIPNPPSGGVTQITAGTNVTISPTNGKGNVTINSSGGGGGVSSPFVSAGFASVNTFNLWDDIAVSPDGTYVYVSGTLLSNNHEAIAQIKVSDGSVNAIFDSGLATNSPISVVVSPDNAYIYTLDGVGEWCKIATSGMTLVHHSTLAVLPPGTTTQQYDLSPDGSTFAYVSGTDAKLYMINTSTYAVTPITCNHTAGNLTAVCFYNGSNTNVYVAHAASGDVDLYTTAGVYTSTVSTGAGGTPSFTAMRSGINSSFFIIDQGTNKEGIYVNNGTPALFPCFISSIAVNAGSQTAIADGNDVYYGVTGGSAPPIRFIFNQYSSLLWQSSLERNGASGIAVLPSSAEVLLTLSGVNYPEIWSFSGLSPTNYSPPGNAGNIQTSNGSGNAVFAAPYSTSGWAGSDTIGGGGTVTITTAVATTGSIIDTTSTTANALAPAVTTKNNGSFVVTGTPAGTFDWVIIKP